MSSMNSMTEGTSSSNSAPKLPKGEKYAEWKPLMEVHLQKVGANGVHKKPLEKAMWLQDEKDVEAWNQLELDQAMKGVGIICMV